MPRARTEWDTLPNPVHDLWTSTNAAEMVPGVVRPFTTQLLNRCDSLAMRALLEEYPAGPRIEVPAPPTACLFGVFGGRLAINMGFSIAAASLLDPAIAEQMLARYFTGRSDTRRYVLDSSAEEQAQANEVATRQREDAPEWLERHVERLLAERRSEAGERIAALDPAAAWARIQELATETALGPINIHLVVSVAAGELHARLAGLLRTAGIDSGHVVGLTSGLGEVESTGPAVALWELACSAREHRAVAEVLRDEGLAATQKLIADPSDEPSRRFAALFAEFRVRWGYHGQGEIDPTRLDWSEDPSFPLSQIRSYLALTDEDGPQAQLDATITARRALEDEVRAQLPTELRDGFEATLAAAQHFTRLRELSKAVWVLAARRLRVPYLALARGLVADGLLDQQDDLSYCLLDEVDQLVGGTPIEDLAERLERRRAQADEASMSALPAFWIGEPPNDAAALVDGGALLGIGVSAGPEPVTGSARHIRSAETGLVRDLHPGEVLIAPSTDAPWTPLFVTAGAVIVETGGVLSHSATVAREFGVPCVVIDGAMDRIPDGAVVTVDGATGTVTIEPGPDEERPPAEH
ncbi:MAG: PEP-utilizing enzyme [Actinomycetota bacterium]